MESKVNTTGWIEIQHGDQRQTTWGVVSTEKWLHQDIYSQWTDND